VYDDFAHHPTAIMETMRAVKAAHPAARVWAVFEPRSATSCRRVFQDDFVRAFDESGADEIVLAPVFRSSLPEAERLDVTAVVAELTRRGRRARQMPGVEAIVELIAQEAREGDRVVVMSNGAFDGLHDKLLARLTR
jgi:UDP-N-acetylmuramate: L-alanyl-gamma-D-glutamyl-meso-diaminopimelate ligase